MFSKDESKKLRELFWVSFGKSYPKKWILYNTKLKDFSFKFHFDTKGAMISLDVEGDIENRIKFWDKLSSLKSILKEDYLPAAIYDEALILENGKEISRIYITLDQKVSIHNKDTWRVVMEFFNTEMSKFEAFFNDYKEILDA